MNNDSFVNPETTTSPDDSVPYVEEKIETPSFSSYDVSLFFDGYNVSGTITGGDNSELLTALRDIKELQDKQNEQILDLTVVLLLLVAILGIIVGQGFVKILKR